MAKTRAGEELTRIARQQQLQLRAGTLRELLRLWPIWRVEEGASFKAFVSAALPLARQRHRDSAGLASRYYRAFRMAEGVRGEPPVKLATFSVEQAVTSLYITGEVMTSKALQAGMSAELARRNALVRVSGAFSRLVLNGGRHTLVETAAADPKALGWQRVTGGNACEFCQMLAGRGPVYSESTADFQAHDHCGCTPEPVYG